MDTQAEKVRVLHVDDEPDFAETAAAFIERHDDRLSVATATSVSDGLRVLEDQTIECIVSDFDMPATSGIEFLEIVRQEHPDLPFILYTGKGSESVASEAISAGVTDYLQKERGTSHYEVLGNRILNVVEQRRAQLEAAQTEQRLRSIAENASEILWKFNQDWSELLFINSAYEEIWGRSIDELEADSMSFLDGIHPEDRDRVKSAMSRLSAGDPVDIEYRVNEDEDFSRWVWVQGEPVLGEDGTVERVVGFARDITDRKKHERDIQAAKETHQRLIETSPVPIWLQGFEEIYYANDAAANLYGIEDADTLIGMSALDFVPEAEQERARRRNERLLKENEGVETFSGNFDRADGETRIAEISVSPIVYEGERSLVVAARDITSEREREAELERYETLVEVSGDPMYMLDEDGRFTYVNEALVSITGYDEDDLVGSKVQRVMDAEHVDRGTALIESLLDRGVRRGTFEMELVTTEGEQIPVETHLSVMYDEDGAFTGSVGVLRDITDRRNRERKLERERDRLEQFAGVVSHDLRNPLTVAQGRLQLASEEVANENIDAAIHALDRMEQLIEDVLSLARAGETVGDTEEIPLATLVENCWRNVATGSAELVIDTDITVSADRSRLQQLLENLLANAVEHGGEDVTITVGDLEHGFYVADDGPGIPVDKRGEIFDPGQARGQSGTGFGLSIVQDIADAHGWSVSVTESEAGGARFEISDVGIFAAFAA